MKDNPISIRNVSFAYGTVEVVKDISLEVAHNEFVALVGPSGCGKTTLLNLLAGDLQARSGVIVCHGVRRTVYQQGGLLPWLTVEKNIALSLSSKPGSNAYKAQLQSILEWIGLSDFAGHYPHQLSGGMRQRVELGRALTGKPDVLLLDEPFSALDYLTRLRMRRELSGMLGEKPCTAILVTHDIEEAAQMADRILVLSNRPMECCGELRINSPRPRGLTQPEVIDAITQVMAMLGLEEEHSQNLHSREAGEEMNMYAENGSVYYQERNTKL